jgi:UPF0716 family protein affecting phage T7 exclusion
MNQVEISLVSLMVITVAIAMFVLFFIWVGANIGFAIEVILDIFPSNVADVLLRGNL